MSKKTYICPICHVQVKDLKGHTARMHPEKPKPEVKVKPTGKTLEFKTPLEKSLEKAEKQGYHCVDCGGPLTKGETPCPGCGAHLNWSQA